MRGGRTGRFARRWPWRVLAALVIVAACAPLLASELPLVVVGARRWAFPAFRALGAADCAWLAAAVAVAGARSSVTVRRATLAAVLAIAAAGALRTAPRAVVMEDLRVRLAAADSLVLPAPIPHDDLSTDLAARLLPSGSPGHLLGTDHLGRDVGARLLAGLRLSLLVALATTALATILGVLLGLAAASRHRLVLAGLGWIIDALASVPAIFAVALLRAAGIGSMTGLVALIGIWRGGYVARLVREEARRVKEEPFVEAAQALGLRRWSVTWRHVLPHAVAPALVAAAFGVGATILAEAGLSFLGIGVPEPLSSLGSLIADGRRAAPEGVALVLAPGVILLALLLAGHALASDARDALDPRGRDAAG